uniref:Vesicle transport protein n=1 Tax=Phlebotomus papatasi TaxID=29031 RepID=A0A1B0DKV7_PHLPP
MVRQMFTRERIVLSVSYTGCLLATLYFAMWAQSTALTVLFAVLQIICLLCMILSSIPGGISGMKFFGQMFKSSVSNTLPCREMANLKQDLDEYLLLQSDQKKTFKVDVKLPQIKVPDVGKLFRKNDQEPANGWLRETQDTCCPKLSRIQRIIAFVTCLALGLFCFTLSTFYIPVLVLKSRKFALLC